jgi:alcohol dehydrogenase (cytochrome c)
MMSFQRTFGLCALVLFGSRSAVGQPGSFVPVTDRMLQNPDPNDWLMWRRTLNSWGYSPLNQINRANVGTLKMVWSRGMGPGVQEATPLAYRGVLYLPNPSDLVQALNGTTGDLIWEYKRKLPDDVNKFLLVPSINRNLAIYGNLIIDTSVDDFVYALDTALGKSHRGLPRRFGAGDFGAHHREWQDHLRPRLRV